ncbi:MAG: NAD(+)/NADH kinase [Ruminococcaceae bacterium]|nr:NAD(+)/NADH kinase [Oscillospiraceae bacterium]
MKKLVFVLPNKEKQKAIEAAEGICQKILSWGYDAEISAMPENALEARSLERADYLVVLGGDGSIIQVARATTELNIPIVGINYGKVGYMAVLGGEEADELRDILAGNHIVQKRMMLDVDIIKGDRSVRSFSRALNEAVVSNGPIPHLVEFDLYCDGNLCQHIRSDGIIIATPTGSSAYSMSAGGPVMDPSLSCICATPICPHHLNSRPVIFGGDSVLEIKNARCRNNYIYLSVDGKEVFEIGEGDVVRIAKSKYTASIVSQKNNSFIEVLNSKLSYQ